MRSALSPIRDSVLDTVGGTPVVRLRRIVPEGGAQVLVKLEYFNPTGSYKDRMALAMIEGAERRGALRPGMSVVEYTGGSTGSSLAMVCAVKGYAFTPLSSDAWSQEKLKTMRAFGADLQVIPSEDGRITAELVRRLREEAERQAQAPGVFYTDQFHNEDAVGGYMGIGRELLEQVGSGVSAFCGGVGTAGMLVGVSRAFREGKCPARIIALEPAAAPLLSRGERGAHRVEGIGAGFAPPHLTRGVYDEVRTVDEMVARETARRLAREEGIFAGTSTGLNVAAALQLAQELGPEHVVVTVAVDTGLKYLAGDLFTSGSTSRSP
jgi:cysteine synthase A